jgi:hypothetical protein
MDTFIKVILQISTELNIELGIGELWEERDKDNLIWEVIQWYVFDGKFPEELNIC